MPLSFALQTKPIGWRVAAVGRLDVGTGQVHVGPHHIKAGMAQDALEGEDVTAVTQVAEGKGVPERVG